MICRNNFPYLKRAVVEWLETLSSGEESCRKSGDWDGVSPSDDWETLTFFFSIFLHKNICCDSSLEAS